MWRCSFKIQRQFKKTAKDLVKVLEKERRELFEKELKELNEREKKMIRTCESLEEDSTKYSVEAETKSDLEARKLLGKANALKRKQNELKIKVKGLQDETEQRSQKYKRSLADKWLFQYILCWHYVVLFPLLIFKLLVYFLSWEAHVL